MSDDPVLNILNQITERCLEKDRERRFRSAREIFTIRGAQLVLAAPIVDGGGDERTETLENIVTYREPPNWLVWSGPILLGSLVMGIVAFYWLATRTKLALYGLVVGYLLVFYVLPVIALVLVPAVALMAAYRAYRRVRRQGDSSTRSY